MARSSPHQVSANCDWAKWKEAGKKKPPALERWGLEGVVRVAMRVISKKRASVRLS